MRRAAGVLVVTLLGLPAASRACLRPQIDERAVQWSTAIVEAKLVSIGQKTPLGELQERQGALGALGVATTRYAYRVYDFEVTRAVDGPYKKGDHVPVLRIWMSVENPPAICSQHLVKAAVGKEFLLLLRPFSEFELAWPNGIRKPDVRGGMIVVHLEPRDDKAAGQAELGETIVEARGDERQATPRRVHDQIAAVQAAPDDEKAKPLMASLSRMGPKIVPDLKQAADKASGAAQVRLLQLMAELTPPDPVMKSADEPDEKR